MPGTSLDSGLRNGNGLTGPDYFQRSVPLFQFGNADMITMRNTGQGFSFANDVFHRAGTIIGSKVHIKSFKITFRRFAVKWNKQSLSGADIAARGEAVHGFQIFQR